MSANRGDPSASGAASRPEDHELGSLRFGIRRKARLVARVMIGVYCVVFVVMDCMLLSSPRGIAVRAIALGVAFVLEGIILAYTVRRLLRASVLATPSGLCIYNGLRTHVVAWSEIAGFEPSNKPFLMAVRRTHGRPITMTGITPESLGQRAAQEESMRELEDYWQRMMRSQGRLGAFSARRGTKDVVSDGRALAAGRKPPSIGSVRAFTLLDAWRWASKRSAQIEVVLGLPRTVLLGAVIGI